MEKRVIVDIDAGTDDAFALILLLEQNIKIAAITCVNGNTRVHNVYNNVQRILKLCKRTDIPVYLGAAEPLLSGAEDNKNYYHGTDGFGDLQYENDGITVKENCKNNNKMQFPEYDHTAIEQMNKIVSDNPGEISIICLGPLTNVALAIKVYSGFAKNVKEIFIMGGNYKGIGNVTSSAEFNFYVDPEAAYIVLHYSKCPITILPWEPCIKSTLTFEWRYNVLGKCNHPTMSLLNAAEKSIYSESEKIWQPCDAYLVALMLFPEIIKKMFTCKVSVELQGVQTRAQMVILHVEKDLEPNARVVTEIDMDLFKTVLLKNFNK